MSARRDSENEDDPEPFQSSGDEWDAEAEKGEKGRRKSNRVSRPSMKKLYEDSEEEEEGEGEGMSSEEEEEDEDSEEERPSKKRKTPSKPGPKSKNSNAKKSKASNDSEEEEGSNDGSSNYSHDDGQKEGDSDSNKGGSKAARKFLPKTIFSDDFANGSFVILKKDAQGGDPSKHPIIWRIDGKALLQKYEAFDEDSKVYHKNTSVYTGWSPLDKELYAPITVDVIRHNNSNLTVEVHWEQLKLVNNDDDE